MIPNLKKSKCTLNDDGFEEVPINQQIKFICLSQYRKYSVIGKKKANVKYIIAKKSQHGTVRPSDDDSNELEDDTKPKKLKHALNDDGFEEVPINQQIKFICFSQYRKYSVIGKKKANVKCIIAKKSQHGTVRPSGTNGSY
ncbi:unnamed protein product [Rotaria sordida]|uniref:Uncharacterized protein n=1 Tax=Rotaria sordida TaxID=392033 RepID=A0A815M026_9BILA|nr:unnamed protein product [Rotaria sordida]